MKHKFILFFIILFTCVFQSISQEDIFDLGIPKEIADELLDVVKSRDYNEIIRVSQILKKKHPHFINVFDTVIIQSYFELKDFDKVIYNAEPYLNKKESLIGNWTLELTLGQAYVQKERLDEGCELLKNVRINDYEFRLVFASNCLDYKEYTFTVPGYKMNSKTDLGLRADDVVDFKATGEVVYGLFAGSAGPAGFSKGVYRNYNRTQEMNHGELFFTVSSDPYLFYEHGALSLIESTGNLVFHINDKGISNNRGSFTAIIKVYRR